VSATGWSNPDGKAIKKPCSGLSLVFNRTPACCRAREFEILASQGQGSWESTSRELVPCQETQALPGVHADGNLRLIPSALSRPPSR